MFAPSIYLFILGCCCCCFVIVSLSLASALCSLLKLFVVSIGSFVFEYMDFGLRVHMCIFDVFFRVWLFFPVLCFFPSFFRSCCFSIVRTFANSRCFQLNKLLCALLSIFGDVMCHGDATPECINKQNKYECRRKKTKQHTSTHTRAPTRS